MLQVRNETPYQASLTLLGDRDGVDTLFAIIKGTFTLESQPRLAEEQVPVTVAPEYHGEPGTSSLKRPADISIDKSGTDVVVLGEAHAPDGRAVRMLDVSVTVGPLYKAVRVFGDREWVANGATYSITTPEPFVTMPSRGSGRSAGMTATTMGRARNPQSSRHRVPCSRWQRSGRRTSPSESRGSGGSDHGVEASAGAGRARADRCALATATIVRWDVRRAVAADACPLPPEGFDPRFLQIAPPGLGTSSHLQGGEPAELHGMTPDGVARFRLPSPGLRVAFHLDGVPNERPALLDTVVLEPTSRRFSVVWRASLKCEQKGPSREPRCGVMPQRGIGVADNGR